ncbi:hypothetical protein AVEN_98083-1 [Araneus ventricosus]|uniref:Uncharacterized protein n=1 Tax=Araneus ventricosus TaxID=182803 RepID=A0A4Y2VCV7_ARAVE|nr:hypothetical protein AVEN_98083-1 [Araneus ventricosus]
MRRIRRSQNRQRNTGNVNTRSQVTAQRQWQRRRCSGERTNGSSNSRPSNNGTISARKGNANASQHVVVMPYRKMHTYTLTFTTQQIARQRLSPGLYQAGTRPALVTGRAALQNEASFSFRPGSARSSVTGCSQVMFVTENITVSGQPVYQAQACKFVKKLTGRLRPGQARVSGQPPG